MQRPLIVTAVGALPVILSGKEWKGIVAIGAGVMAGDVIKKVDNKPVLKILNRSKEVIKNVDISEGAQLDILRKKRLVYFTMRLINSDREAW